MCFSMCAGQAHSCRLVWLAELSACHRLNEMRTPSELLLRYAGRYGMVVARVHLSSRYARIFDGTRVLLSSFMLDRRERCRMLQVPEFRFCSWCGLDCTGQCASNNCGMALCRWCRPEFTVCRTCQLERRPEARDLDVL